jgi:hypothetical protein
MNSVEFDDGIELISYALKNNCSREIYDLLFKTFVDAVKKIFLFFIILKIFLHIL